LTKNSTFHALCDKNRKNEDYLFLWRRDNVLATGVKGISPHLGEPFHFFDLTIEWWYSIPSMQMLWNCGYNPNEDMVQWFLNMDNGLVCEAIPFKTTKGRTFCLSILDPVAQTSTGLPSPNVFFPPPHYDEVDPSLVIVVDHVTKSYKVFFFNRLKDMPLAYVLESSTQEWRPVGGLIHHMNDAIAFQNTVFAIFHQGTTNFFLSSQINKTVAIDPSIFCRHLL